MRRRFAIYGSGAGAAEPPYTEQTVCLDLNGSDEKLAHTTVEQALGLANAWTAAMWFKPHSGSFTAEKYIMQFRPSIGGNAVLIRIRGHVANDPIYIFNASSGGSIIKAFSYDSLAVQDAWNLLVLTWDGTDLVLYHDGTEQTPTTKDFDNAGTMTDSARGVRLGGSVSRSYLDGRYFSAGMWSVTLTSGEQAELYSEGGAMDWGSNGVTYASSASLQHWWRLGHDSADIGADSGVHGSPVDVMEDAENISAADIVTDAPA